VTYASLALTSKDDAGYDRAVSEVSAKLGAHFSMYVNGEQWMSTGEEVADFSPINVGLAVSYFPEGTRDDAKAAVDAAREAFRSWSELPYKNRVKVLLKAADLLVERKFELSAWMAFEVGKNRAESLAEVNEAAELIRYYCNQMKLNKGFTRSMESPGPGQETVSVLRPYGVWAVIAPWNFPLALSTGMTAGALAGGNTVVFKPSSESRVLGYELSRGRVDAGVPRGVFIFVSGPGDTVGSELQENPHVDGMIFTGSREVGMRLVHGFAKNYPKPVIAEMGGKNPAIVSKSAELDEAAEGVMRAAFGFGGQKCSACARVYVAKAVRAKFLGLLERYVKTVAKVGNPTRKETFLGPLINEAAVATYTAASERTLRDGGRLLSGGHKLTSDEFKVGHYVDSAVVVGLPPSHELFREELFVPFLVVAPFDSFSEALDQANSSDYGLCAGLYTRDRDEVSEFMSRIQAGVTYVNRRAGATTGAWPGVNSFGGWRGSGSTGKNALGQYYVQQFMREQSRWVVKFR
jgi:1-pyrroline-5-carboxylate dehydrogenase